MHFLVFIPDCTPAALDQRAKSSDLSDVLGGHDVFANHPGPQAQTGLMLGWCTPTSPRMNYSEPDQVWVPSHLKIEETPAYWVGFWKDKPPAENELRRVPTQPGPVVPLGDGRWKLPTPNTVDAEAVYRADGTMFWKPIERFAWMCDEAEVLRQQYLDELGIRMYVYNDDPTAQIDWICKLLRVNYRITPEVAAYLHLWVGREKIFDLFLSTLGLVRKKDEGADG